MNIQGWILMPRIELNWTVEIGIEVLFSGCNGEVEGSEQMIVDFDSQCWWNWEAAGCWLIEGEIGVCCYRWLGQECNNGGSGGTNGIEMFMQWLYVRLQVVVGGAVIGIWWPCHRGEWVLQEQKMFVDCRSCNRLYKVQWQWLKAMLVLLLHWLSAEWGELMLLIEVLTWVPFNFQGRVSNSPWCIGWR